MLSTQQIIKVRTENKEVFWVKDMCPLSDNTIVMVDFYNSSLKLVDGTTGNIIHQLTLQNHPHGVCAMSGDRVAVTYGDRIQVYISSSVIIIILLL